MSAIQRAQFFLPKVPTFSIISPTNEKVPLPSFSSHPPLSSCNLFSQPHLPYVTFFPWRERSECRKERERKKEQKKWFFEIPAFSRVFTISTILFLPRLGSALLPCYPPPYPTSPSLSRSYLPRGSFHSMEFQSCPWRRLATRAFPIFHSALHKERRPIGI